MSIWSSLVSVAAPIVGSFFGPAGTAIGQAVGQSFAPKPAAGAAATTTQVGAFSPAAGFPDLSLNGAAPTVPVAAAGKLPPGVLANITGPLSPAGGACPTGFHLDKRTRSKCVRNRRMNPLNGRAASRAIRRIKGARKMLQKIERGLPRAKARATPRHPHRVHVHTE